MTATRSSIAIALLAGLAWGAAVIWAGSVHLEIPQFSRIVVTPFFLLGPGLVLLAMLLVAVGRRAKAEARAESYPLPGSGWDRDVQALQGTVAQAVLAACLWPPISFLLLDDGLGVTVALGIAFVPARLLCWAGCHLSPALRIFGAAATLLPTLMALAWGGFLRLA
jgi:hypothetical protein